MELTVATQNLREGAWGSLDPARPDPDFDRLHLVIERLSPAAADVLVLNEVRDQRPYNHGTADPADHVRGFAGDRDRMEELGEALGMSLAGITPSRSGIPSAVLYRPGRLTLTGWHDRFSHWYTNGCGTAVFNLAELDEPLAVATVHADPWAWIDTARELQRTVALVSEYHALGIVAGDFNCAPAYGALPRVARCGPTTG